MDQGMPAISRNPRIRQRSASTSNLTQSHAAQEQHADNSEASTHDAASLARYASAARNQAYFTMLSQGYYPPMSPLTGFYGNHDNMPPPQSVSPNFPWHLLAPPSHLKSRTNQCDVLQASSSTSLNPLAFIDSQNGLLHPSDGTTSNPQQAQVSTVHSHNSSSAEVESTEAEPVAVSDEKRRRNTAASARFRIKKKHRTIALERTVSDLTGRAEKLEREVGDLRRENGWLKEIVMLKGTQNIANALRQVDASKESSSEFSDDETPVVKSKGKQTKSKI